MRSLPATARATVLVLACLAWPLVHRTAWTDPGEGASREVTLATGDKLQVLATFHPSGGKGGPGAVLLPMFLADRGSWDPLIEPLQARGVGVLAVDPRGHGRSAKQGTRDLGLLVEKRDPALFAAMHNDATAAVRWLVKEAGCDPKRIVLIGAGVGGSVALDTAARHPSEVAAVVWMSPGVKFLGLDSLAHAKTLPPTFPLMLLAHRGEADGAGKLQALRPTTRLVVYDDPPPPEAGAERAWAQGTRMFGRIPLVERTVASLAALAAGSTTEDVVLDGVVTDVGPGADPWDRAVDVGGTDGGGRVRAFRVGRRILFGGVAPPDVVGLVFEVQTGDKEVAAGELTMLGPPQTVAVDLKGSRVLWSFGGMGSMPSFPGMPGGPMFGKTRPVLRAVATESGTTFEGEWEIPRFGGESRLIRLFIGLETTLPPMPEQGMVAAHPTVDLPSR